MRYSSLRQIHTRQHRPAEAAWTFRTGKPGSEAVPIVVDGVMYVTAPDGVYAVVPETGELLWKYDAAPVALRGLAYWPGAGGMHSRVFAGNGPFLLALDVTTGKPAPGFGERGPRGPEERGAGRFEDGRYALQSPPAVFGDVVITGCSNGEGSPTAGAYGDIRGWDAKTGSCCGPFTPCRGRVKPGSETWPPKALEESIGDQCLGLLHDRCEAWDRVCAAWLADLGFLWRGPRGRRPVRKFAGGARRADGPKKWHRQLVHHDLWDYDLAAPPALFDIHRGGRVIPAVAQITKMGLLFVFDRVTGEPVYGMEERPVPQNRVPGEVTSKTQPFPLKPPPLGKNTFRMEEMYDRSPEHARFCKELFETNQMKIGGPYTPLPLEGNAAVFSEHARRRKLGRRSIDPSLGLVVRERNERRPMGAHGEAGLRVHAHLGVRDLMRGFGIAKTRIPCQNPPFGELVAVDLASGDIAWRSRVGEDRSAGGDRRARYGNVESGRKHRDGGRAGVYRGDERLAIPGVRFADRQDAVGKTSWRPAGTPARLLIWVATAGNMWR